MEEYLQQFRQQLSIIEESEHQSGGYLNYIKSKYLKAVETDNTRIKCEWEIEFEESQSLSLAEPPHDILDSASRSSVSIIEGDEAAGVLILPSALYSGGAVGSPNPVLFDNFVEEDGGDSAVDFGDYMPSGLSSSPVASLPFSPCGPSVAEEMHYEVEGEGLSRLSTAGAAEGSNTTDEIEDLSDDEDDEEELQGVVEDEDQDFFSCERLPPRVAEALLGMRNTDATLSAGIGGDDRHVGSIETSDVYAFEEEDD